MANARKIGGTLAEKRKNLFAQRDMGEKETIIFLHKILMDKRGQYA
jgi:hypothetical protein